MEHEASESVVVWKCPRCSMPGEPHKTDTHICVSCANEDHKRVSHYRQQNYNWMELAAEADIAVFERQPAETDYEWSIWLEYRNHYPGKRPSYRSVAEHLGNSVFMVQKIGARWDFSVRMQAWTKHVDALILAKRESEILAMNERHITLAERISAKLEKAIEQIDPLSMSPSDIKGLFSVMTDIERKARLDQVSAVTPKTADEPQQKRELVDPSQLQDILAILGKAGALNGNIGVKQTVTTEVVKLE